jgi:hypothetical protein
LCKWSINYPDAYDERARQCTRRRVVCASCQALAGDGDFGPHAMQAGKSARALYTGGTRTRRSGCVRVSRSKCRPRLLRVGLGAPPPPCSPALHVR